MSALFADAKILFFALPYLGYTLSPLPYFLSSSVIVQNSNVVVLLTILGHVYILFHICSL